MASQGGGSAASQGPPPTRGEWSSPPPSRVEWSPVPPRAEWSAPPTPRGLRAELNNAAERVPAHRPQHLPTDRDKSTLKVFLPSGCFNVVKFGDATDIKVGYIGIPTLVA